jgi:chloramphenicol-sensitive protein RarD
VEKRREGLILGVGSYLWWGFLPLYLSLMEPTGALELIAHRVLWSLACCLILLVAVRQVDAFTAAVRDGRTLGILAVSGALLTINWLVFVYATLSGQLVDAALGYFINPLVSVALGVVLLGERLRPAQWVAVGIAGTAIVAMTVATGHFPWIGLALAFSFGLYGYVEKRVGARIPALTALTVETLTMTPFAIGYLIWVALAGTQTFLHHGGWHVAAVIGIGAVTVVPLLLFNGAARRLPLSTVGMLQYLCPVMQFITGIAIFHEPMSPARWFGFGAVWVALIVLSADAVVAARRPRPPRVPSRSASSSAPAGR